MRGQSIHSDTALKLHRIGDQTVGYLIFAPRFREPSTLRGVPFTELIETLNPEGALSSRAGIYCEHPVKILHNVSKALLHSLFLRGAVSSIRFECVFRRKLDKQ